MRIGIIGSGVIVDTFLQAVQKLNQIECVALCTRNADGPAKSLAEKYNIGQLYTDFEAMLADDRVDVCYLALPNSLHYEYALRTLNFGKHVIVEKPFVTTVDEADTLIGLAKSKGLFIFEGITTLHLPNYHIIQELLPQIGTIKLIGCNYSQYSSRYDLLLKGEEPNIFNLAFAGGALMDINIYNIHFVLGLFGEPEAVHYMANKAWNGVDTSGVLTLKYSEFVASCIGAKDCAGISNCFIQGTTGSIHTDGPANHIVGVTLIKGENKTFYNEQEDSHRMVYELSLFKKLFDEKDLNQAFKLLEHTRRAVEVTEKARESASIIF